MLFRALFVALLLAGFVWSPACSPKPDTETTTETPQTDSGTTDTKGRCTYPSDCDKSETCQEGKCVAIKCATDSDCRGGLVCRDTICYEKDKAPCQSDDECTTDPKKWKCEKGTCIDGGCRNSSDCEDPALPVCNTQTNKCEKKKCSSDSDCVDASKPICDKNSGECTPDTGAKAGETCDDNTPCLRTLNCYEDLGKQTCRVRCTPGSASNKCPKDTICLSVSIGNSPGLCLDPGPGKKEGEDCSGGSDCQRPLRCIYNSKGVTCQRPCASNDECTQSGETCQDHRNKTKMCMPAPDPCGPGRSCKGEDAGWQQCLNGSCKQLFCPDDFSCQPNQKCDKYGKCVDLKCPNEACPDLYKCNSSGKCIRTNESEKCGQGEKIGAKDCGDGLVCARSGYVYSCVRSCTSNSDCSSDMECVTNIDKQQICVQKCPSSGKCKYPGHFCVNLPRTPQGNYCVPAGQPTGQDIHQPCTNSNPCLPDLQCFQNFRGTKGYCVKPCQTQADCVNSSSLCANYSSGIGKGCYYKCPSSGSCSVGNTAGYCSYVSSGTYICRPS